MNIVPIIASLLLTANTIPVIDCPNNDCTSLVQSYLDVGGDITIPPGIYNINTNIDTPHQGGVYVNSNSVVDGKNKVVFKAIPTSAGTYKILNIYADNTVVKNIEIVGDRYHHLGSWGEWGAGVRIANSHNITLEHVLVRDCWGDGIYIDDVPGSRNDTILIKDSKSLNNRRQGMSIISGKNITIDNTILRGTNGTSPQAGIDFEPDDSSDEISNVTISRCTIDNNHGVGVIIYDHVNRVSNVRITNTSIQNNNLPGLFTLNGYGLTVDNSLFNNNQHVSDKYHSEIKLEDTEDVNIYNNNINTNVIGSHGISIYGGFGEIHNNVISSPEVPIIIENAEYNVYDNE
jgi:hypothetical protein